ncbi:MAG: hypothetical protein R3C54_01450 [Parvularculaceae bacterium]
MAAKGSTGSGAERYVGRLAQRLAQRLAVHLEKTGRGLTLLRKFRLPDALGAFSLTQGSGRKSS